MRFTKVNNKFFSLAKRNKNSFWVEYEILNPEDYSCYHFEIPNISWRRFKKSVQRHGFKLYC